MKLINNVLCIILFSAFMFACTNDKKQNENTEVVSQKNLAENLKNVEVQIKGMTCEIGCARLIRSKLYKSEGIKFAKVNFIDSIGNITYDANITSAAEIKNVIQKVAGGDLYTVTGMTEVENFKEIHSQ